MYLSRIRLRNWKNFQSIDTPLGERCFVIGPNASGKSNFLDAFRFLRDVARDGLRKAMDDTRGGVSAIRCLAARRYSQVEILVEIRDSAANGPPDWTYELVRRPTVTASAWPGPERRNHVMNRIFLPTKDQGAAHARAVFKSASSRLCVRPGVSLLVCALVLCAGAPGDGTGTSQ